MEKPSELDLAHENMQNNGDGGQARLQFHKCFSDSELFLLLDAEPKADAVSPMVFPVEGDQYALVFDRQDRLASFSETPVDYVALPGRAIVTILGGRGIGIGLNLGVAPSSYLMSAQAVDWLVQVLDQPSGLGAASIRSVCEPGDVSEHLLHTLGQVLAKVDGLADAIYFVTVQYSDGGQGQLLAIVGAAPGAERTLGQSLSEAVAFGGVDVGRLEVAFFDSDAAITDQIARRGKRLF